MRSQTASRLSVVAACLLLGVQGIAAQDTSSSMAASSSVVSSAASSSSAATSSVSTTSFNVSAVATGTATSLAVSSASSNYTLPSASQTATWPSGLAIQSSVPYNLASVDLDDLDIPTFYYNLINETQSYREDLCTRQVKFCSTAGCASASSGATIKENYCTVTTMATRCSCSSGDSNLPQYHWPVELADCQNRASACTSACMQITTISDQSTCKTNCQNVFRNSCGLPGQIAADYSTEKANDTPEYSYIQGGTASSGAMSGRRVAALVGGSSAAVVVILTGFLVM